MVLLNLKIQLQNTGNVLITLKNATIRIQKILPLPDKVTCLINDKEALEKEIPYEYWQKIAEENKQWENNDFSLEPGENETISLTFILNSTIIRTILIYTQFQHPEEKHLVWKNYTVHELGKNEFL